MRIVSLCPSLTELVFDLGAGDELVGCTKFCVHPADGVRRVEKVGGTKNPKISRIVELAPDIVLLNEEENRLADAAALVEAGIPCNVSFPITTDDTAEMVRDIGVALNRSDRAEQIAADILHRAERVRARAHGTKPINYAYMIWHNPWMVAAGDTFVSEMRPCERIERFRQPKGALSRSHSTGNPEGQTTGSFSLQRALSVQRGTRTETRQGHGNFARTNNFR
jgi:iron complex transport system substrate-binding protein